MGWLPICPQCGGESAPGDRHCPLDGSPLVYPPPDDPYAGMLFEGRYRLLERIGEGGVGAVYRALHVAMRKTVAVKILHGEYADHPEFPNRFRREARAVSLLNHPNIVSVTDFGTEGDTSYLVMEFLEGVSLWDVLQREKPLSPGRAALILKQILDALDHAHKRGVIHRDLKSANIFLCPSPFGGEQVKLLDFGFAKIVSQDASDASFVSQKGIVFGTAAYMSPEQASGSVVDARTDIYSAGVLAFEMFTGHRPFTSQDDRRLILKHIYDEPPLPRSLNPSLSEPLEALILTALAKKRDLRFPSAEAFSRALVQVPEWSGVKEESIGQPAADPRELPTAISLPAAQGPEHFPTAPLRRASPPKKKSALPSLLGVTVLALGFLALAFFGRGSAAESEGPSRAAGSEAATRPTARAEELLAQGKIAEAERELTRLANAQPPEPYANYLLGNLYASRAQWSEALSAYERAIDGDPARKKDATLLRNTARALLPETYPRAKKILLQAGNAALPALREASQEDDPTLRENARKLLKEIENR